MLKGKHILIQTQSELPRPIKMIRRIRVVLDGQASDPVPVLSGVPHGSVLGPVLFLIFINGLPENIRSSVRLFADDCVLYRNIKSPIDCSACEN